MQSGSSTAPRIVRAGHRHVARAVFALVAVFGAAPAIAGVDLVVNNGVTADTVPAGGIAEFVVRVDNNSDTDTATGVTLTDVIPGGTTLVSATPVGQGSCDPISGTTLTCHLGTLAPIANASVRIQVRTGTAGTIVNTASASATQPDDNNADNTNITKQATVTQGADLALTASQSATTVNAGGPLSYTLSVTNQGPNASGTARVTINLPPTFTRTAALPSGCSGTGNTVTCDAAAPFAVNASRSYTIGGVVNSAGSSNITMSASATIADGGALDPDSGNNTATLTTAVNPGSDLSIVKTASIASPIVQGTAFNFRLVASYTGDDPASVVVTDPVPAAFTVNGTPAGTGWTCNAAGQTVTCSRAAGLGAGYNKALPPITVPVVAATVVTGAVNTAHVASSATDTNTTNNDGSVNVSVVAPSSDLQAFKTGPNPALASVGSTFDWSISMKNNGTAALAGTARLTDTLPVGLTVTAINPNGWTCSPAVPYTTTASDRTLTCERDYTAATPLAVNGTTGAVSYTVRSNVEGNLSNSVCADAHASANDTPAADNNPGNNCVSSGVGVQAGTDSADLKMLKSADLGTVPAGDVLTYTLEAVNAGPNTSKAVAVTDLLDNLINNGTGATGQGFISATIANAAGGTCSTATANTLAVNLTCSLGDVAPCTQGGTCPVITVKVRPGGDGGARTNTATTLSQVTADPNYADNGANVTTQTEARADVTVTVDGNPSPATAGQNLTYVFHVNNGDYSSAGTVNLAGVLPHDVTFVSATVTGGGTCPTKPAASATITAANQALACTWSAIARNASQTVTVVVRPNDASRGTTLATTAHVSTATTETNSGNNDAAVNVLVSAPVIDLVASLSDNPDPVAVDDLVAVTFKITNSGPSFAENPRFTAQLPGTLLSFQSLSAPGATCSTPAIDSVGGVITCTYASGLAAGGSLTAVAQLKGVAKGNAVQTIVDVTSDEAAFETQTTNNHATEGTTVRTKADVQVVSKTASPGTTGFRENFNFVIAIRNNGPGVADNVKVTDTLPAGMVMTGVPTVAVTGGTFPSAVGCAASSGTVVSCDLGQNITVGATANITVPVRVTTVPSANPATYNNTATISATSLDTVPANNSNSGSVQITTSSLGGSVYNDANGDAVRQGGEAGIANVTITLTGTAVDGTPVSKTTTTDASGAYAFALLPKGTYTVTETQPAAWLDGADAVGTAGGTPGNDTVGAIDLPSNTAATGYTFGEYGAGGLAGAVYRDLDNDGVKAGGGETGIAGVTVTVTGTDDRGAAVSLTTTTDATGAYRFATLRPGTYTVIETQPAGFLPGKATVGTGASSAGTASADGNTISGVTLTIGQQGAAYNFGELPGNSLSGTVFVDGNRNGAHDASETAGISGVTVTLTGTDDRGTPVNLTTTTDGAGAYTFTNLRPGTYQIAETQPAQWDDGGETVGRIGGTPRGGVAGNDTIGSIVLVAGESGTGYDFGELGQGLGGFVYVDSNGNGVRDASEKGIAGVTLTVTNTTTNAVTTVTTDASGGYLASNLPAGTYRIAETQPGQYLDGQESVGTLGGSHAANDVFDGITLGVAQVGANYNFGELAASLAGAVFIDGNDNGTREAGESGLAGVSVTLTGTDVNGATVNVTTVTDASGNYGFTDLLPSGAGGYTITETQPPAYADGKEHAGNLGGTPGAAGTSVISAIPVTPGAKGTAYDFAERTGGIAGAVYFDANNNGVRDAGEKPVAGVSVRLSGTDVDGGAVDRTVTTGADGNYVFAGLTKAGPGGYTLVETQPAGYIDGKAVHGNIDGVACAACDVASTNHIAAIPFDPAQTFAGFDFPELQPSSLAGTVYDDIDGNNRVDSHEGLGGITVTLTGTDDLGNPVTKTTTTAGDGTYAFDGLRPGNYVLTETQPAGLGDVGAHAGTAGGGLSGLNSITTIALPAGTAATGYDFLDHGNILSGAVYFDKNGNGVRDAGEAGIAGVTVTLTGPVTRTVTTDATGAYQFAGLTAGTYAVVETQPRLYKDGGAHVGTSGGTAVTNGVSSIVLAPGANALDYDFPELTGADGSIAGTVWVNNAGGNPTSQEPGERGLAGWIVELLQNGTRVPGVAAATTDAGGHYLITGVPAEGGYEVRFQAPNGVYYGMPVSQGPDAQWNGTVDPNASVPEIAGITVGSGVAVTAQDLPLDPSGVVYDAVSRQPLAGARVTLVDGSGAPVPSQYLAGGAANVTQTTGPDGFYQFILLPGAPRGVYSIKVEPPVGYLPPPSGIHAPAGASFTVPGGNTTYHVSSLAGPPASGDLPPYFLSFVITPNSVGVAGNHIPVDPVLQGALRVRKTTPKINVTKGDLVPYTIEITNTLAVTLKDIAARDLVPAGFKYRNDSSRVDGVAREPVINGRSLTWPDLTMGPNQTRTVQLVLVIGSGVGEGEYTNQAWAMNTLADRVVSNVGSAVVRLVPDPTFDCADLIGKVFDDRNGNGYQDQGEPGVPAIRIATPRGLLVTTDDQGRYHVPCAEAPEHDRGLNWIMKLDERSLPTGYRLTTENPGDVRLTPGKMAKLNFGVALHRVVRVDVSADAFEAGGDTLKAAFVERLPALREQMAGKPTVLRLGYHLAAGEKRGQADDRLKALRKRIEDDWRRSGDGHPLLVEQEVIEVQP